VIMPVIAFSLYPMALMARYTRASTLEVTYADYVRMGRARGLSERRILFKYILRTSLIPLITIMGPWIPQLLTGSIFIEATFALPGLGSYFTTASLRRDYPLIMALVLIVAVLWGVCFILSDIAYALVDPRVRIEGMSK
jgi:peptide/nickel transport system permease protein